MALKPSTGFWNALAGGSSVNTIFANGTAEIRSGAAPSDADQAMTGTVLSTVPLGATPFTLSGRVLTKNGTWQDALGDAAGTAAHVVFKSATAGNLASTTDARILGTVTVTAGGGDLTLDTTTISTALPVTITSATITFPLT